MQSPSVERESAAAADVLTVHDGAKPAAVQFTLADLQRLMEQQTQAINDKLASQVGTLREDIDCVLNTVQTIASDIADLKERTRTLESTCDKLYEKQDDVAETVDDLQEDLEELKTRYDEELDKLEAFSRRDNLRFFGLAETPGETFDSCAAKVVDCLKDTVPGKNWSVDDVVRAHRVGQKPNFASMAASQGSKPKSRPMIVKLRRWQDKMDILTNGRAALKRKDIQVASDLTTRQSEQIRKHREKGLHAYFKGSKLIVAGPLKQQQQHSANGSYNNHPAPGNRGGQQRETPNASQRQQTKPPASSRVDSQLAARSRLPKRRRLPSSPSAEAAGGASPV